MITAVDTSVLLALLKREAGWLAWSEALRVALTEGPLIVCPVVSAEIATGFLELETCLESLHGIGIEYSPLESRAAWLAGQVFVRYRREGGPREHLIPDFLIGAHATVQAGRLAAIDRGYLSRYFEELRLLTPEG